MKSVTLKVPDELYSAYKVSCASTGTKLSHNIILTMEDIAYGYKRMGRKRRKVSANKISKRRDKRK